MQMEMPGRRAAFDATAGSVSLSGDLDIYALPELERTLAGLDAAHVVVDLHGVRIVSAAFIGALVRLRWRLPDSRIDLVGANPNVRRTFSVVGVGALVNVI